MKDEIKVIRQNRSIFVLISSMALLGIPIVFYETDNRKSYFDSEREFSILALFLITIILCYCIYKLVLSKPQIVISSKGIFLAGKGMFEWIDIEKFWISRHIDYEKYEQDALHFILKNERSIKYELPYLEKNLFEITQIIHQYSEHYDLKFLGYKEEKQDY